VKTRISYIIKKRSNDKVSWREVKIEVDYGLTPNMLKSTIFFIMVETYKYFGILGGS